MSNHKPKISNALLGVVSIFAIVIIIWLTTISTNNLSQRSDPTGQAAQVALSTSAGDITSSDNLAYCKLVIGKTAIYDDKTLAVNLGAGESAYYSGFAINVKEVTKDNCVVSVDASTDNIALGQILELNSLYITVKDIVK